MAKKHSPSHKVASSAVAARLRRAATAELAKYAYCCVVAVNLSLHRDKPGGGDV
jgi:hypothetical protein